MKVSAGGTSQIMHSKAFKVITRFVYARHYAVDQGIKRGVGDRFVEVVSAGTR